jgi:hypothetical protein
MWMSQWLPSDLEERESYPLPPPRCSRVLLPAPSVYSDKYLCKFSKELEMTPPPPMTATAASALCTAKSVLLKFWANCRISSVFFG